MTQIPDIWRPVGEDREPPSRRSGEIIQVGLYNNLRKHVLDDKMKPRDNILLFFTNISCIECKAGLTEMAKLAAMLDD
jgi:hypothetical protein